MVDIVPFAIRRHRGPDNAGWTYAREKGLIVSARRLSARPQKLYSTEVVAYGAPMT